MQTWISRKKRICISLIIIIVILVYLFIAHPILASMVIPSIEHSGVDLYKDGTYLRYKKADVFKKGLSELSFLPLTDITDFSYKNSFLRDSFYNGKFPDLFEITVSLGDNYESAKEEVQAKSFSQANIWGIDLYFLGKRTDEDSFCVALYDEEKTAICILLTDCEYVFADSVLIRHFPLPGM